MEQEIVGMRAVCAAGKAAFAKRLHEVSSHWVDKAAQRKRIEMLTWYLAEQFSEWE